MTDSTELPSGDWGNATAPFLVAVQSADIPMIFIDAAVESSSIAIANPSFLAMTGLTPSEVLGRSISSVFADITDAMNVETLEARLAAGQPATWETSFHKPGGATYLAGALLHPLRDHAGVHRQHLLSFYVLDGRLKLPRSSFAEARTLYKHAPGFIATSEGPQHRFTFANDSYKRFVGHQTLEGLTVAEAMPEIAAQGFVAILDRVYNTGVPYRGDMVPFDLVNAENGETVRRYADFVYEPVRDADLTIVGIFCEGYDVTEQQEAEAALRTLQTELAHTSRVNAMGTMATTLAHELNQPLSAIANYVTGCLRLIDAGEENANLIKGALGSIDVAAKRAGAIISTLRDLTDRRVRANETFDLKQVVEESINLVRSACSIDTQIYAEIPSGLTLYADRVQIQQVIINLLRNGCDAVSGSPDQKVMITAEVRAEDVQISVCDSGLGVSVEAAAGIFTWSDTPKEGGMGLGLSISRTIIEAHGGRIWLERSGGEGSEFRFSIPLAPPTMAQPAEAPRLSRPSDPS